MVCLYHLRLFLGRGALGRVIPQHKSFISHRAYSRSTSTLPGSKTETLFRRTSVFGRFGYFPKATIPVCPVQQLSTLDIRYKDSLLESNETERLLESIGTKLESRNLSASRLVDFVNEVQKTCYSELSAIKWLHADNAAIAYLQMFMNQKVETFLCPVIEHDVMKALLVKVHKELPNVSNEDCSRLLLSLIYLGIDRTEPLIHKLLDRLLDSVGEMDIASMTRVVEAIRCFPKGHLQLIQKMIPRLHDLTTDMDNFANVEEDFLTQYCILQIYLLYYMGQESSEHFADTLLQILRNRPSLSDPSNIGSCLRYARELRFVLKKEGKEKVLSIARLASRNIPDVIHKFKSNHIAECCHNMTRLGTLDGKVMHLLQTKSSELLDSMEADGSLRIRDVINLAYAFNHKSSPETMRKLKSLILKNVDDLDVLTLSNLADILLRLNLNDQELTYAFQRKTLEMFDTLSQYFTGFIRVVRTLIKQSSTDDDFRTQFFEKLIKLLDCQQTLNIFFLSIVAQYILANVRTTIPHRFMERLVARIPQFDVYQITQVLYALNSMKRPWFRTLQNQVLDLHVALQRNFSERIDSTTSIEEIVKLIRGLYMYNSSKDVELLDRMMRKMSQLTSNLTQEEFGKTVILLKNMYYYNPPVFEDLISHLMEKVQLNDTRIATELITVMSRTGYTPQNFESFVDYCSDLMTRVLETDDIVQQISLGFHLSRMQIFPEASLTKIFTFDFLENIDRHLRERDSGLRDTVEEQLMKLNRNVVLECPQLDVPWFHEEYCQEQGHKLETSTSYSILEYEVEQSLKEMLGRSDLYRARVFSPYWHHINFECVLDSSGSPVLGLDSSDDDLKQYGFQRVAVIVLQEKHFCTNSSHLRGYYLCKCRHLEIMGYKVVLVPHFEWRSMALTDPEERVRYLREKILPNVPKD